MMIGLRVSHLNDVLNDLAKAGERFVLHAHDFVGGIHALGQQQFSCSFSQPRPTIMTAPPNSDYARDSAGCESERPRPAR
jgi:hypothetical protein